MGGKALKSSVKEENAVDVTVLLRELNGIVVVDKPSVEDSM